MHWFDAHLDLAYLGAMGRDMTADATTQGQPHPPASVTLPSLVDAGVSHCLATVFVEAGGDDAEISYAPGDGRGAAAAGLRQLEMYQRWHADGLIRWLHEEPVAGALSVGVLIEGADPIERPEDIATWHRFGVVAVGMAWWRASRYAGGNGTDDGLTALGRELVGHMDALGLVHDLSHLSQRATDELLSLSDGRTIASHSNCRALLDDNQRHIADETIREVARRGGVIGLNLYSRFLSSSCDTSGRASIDDCVRHIEHVCDVTGSRACVGLGSDMDGGFGADRLPMSIDGPADLDRLSDALGSRGWSDDEIRGFAFENWAAYFATS